MYLVNMISWEGFPYLKRKRTVGVVCSADVKPLEANLLFVILGFFVSCEKLVRKHFLLFEKT